MTIEFTTTITSIETYPTYQGVLNYVFKINWSYLGDDGVYKTARSGSTDIPEIDPLSAIPYDQITKEQAMGWITQHTDPSIWKEHEDIITDWITAQYAPSVVTPDLPWSEE